MHVDDDMMKTTLLSGYLGQVVVLQPRDLIGQLVPVRAPDWSAPGCTKLSQQREAILRQHAALGENPRRKRVKRSSWIQKSRF